MPLNGLHTDICVLWISAVQAERVFFVQWKFVLEKMKMSITSAYIECATGKWYHLIELANSFLWSIDIELLQKQKTNTASALWKSFECPASLLLRKKLWRSQTVHKLVKLFIPISWMGVWSSLSHSQFNTLLNQERLYPYKANLWLVGVWQLEGRDSPCSLVTVPVATSLLQWVHQHHQTAPCWCGCTEESELAKAD